MDNNTNPGFKAAWTAFWSFFITLSIAADRGARSLDNVMKVAEAETGSWAKESEDALAKLQAPKTKTDQPAAQPG